MPIKVTNTEDDTSKTYEKATNFTQNGHGDYLLQDDEGRNVGLVINNGKKELEIL